MIGDAENLADGEMPSSSSSWMSSWIWNAASDVREMSGHGTKQR
jgi:hypothetical protein